MPLTRTSILLTVFSFIAFPAEVSSESTWTAREGRILASLSLLHTEPPPGSPTNRFAGDKLAEGLGQALFFDPRLSGNGKVSCASCHQPDMYFTDGLPKSVGLGETSRNAPTIVGTAYLSWFYWDGRRDSLWAQALIPIEAAAEMGSSRLAAVRLVGKDTVYREKYEELFGSYPESLLDPALPRHAGPYGTPEVRDAWHRLTRENRRQINKVFANMGKAIAAYESTQLPAPTRFDRYVDAMLTENGDNRLLSPEEIAGARLFIDSDKTPCLQCHNGPMFTNGGFHNVGSGNFTGEQLDFGRVFGLRAVLMDEFNCLGPYSDAEPRQCVELNFLNTDSHIPLEGAFKVPSLRGLRHTSPYFHDGRFKDLQEVIDYYVTAPQELSPNTHELRTLRLSAEDKRNLVKFLLTLSGEHPTTRVVDDTSVTQD